MNGSASPICTVCHAYLGTHGGPSTLPCGHNGCLFCLSELQRSNPLCPFCRAPFPRDMQLQPNYELRGLVALAWALHSVSTEDNGWQTVAVAQHRSRGRNSCEAVDDGGVIEEDYEDVGPLFLPLMPRSMADVTLEAVWQGQASVLQLQPPMWQADSCSPHCTRCRASFGPLRSWRHHCRLCGNLFCHNCCKRRLLLPRSFQMSRPQRVCYDCAILLEPRQDLLAGTISRAVQTPVHDVTDFSALRSYINVPIAAPMDTYIFQATNIIRSLATPAAIIAPEKHIPSSLLCNAAGFAVLTVAKAAMGWSAAWGGGVVVARMAGGQGWSRPCAISLYSCGWGLQAGGALCDLVLVLRNEAAVRAFCGAVHWGVGIGANLAAGPVGGQAEAGMRLGSNGALAVCYSYSRVRGAFAGVSVDGSLINVRNDLNQDFYGREVSARSLLFGDSPGGAPGADMLHAALDDMLLRVASAPTASSKGPAMLPWRAVPPVPAIAGVMAMAQAASTPASPAASQQPSGHLPSSIGTASDASQLSRMWEAYPAVSAPPFAPYGQAPSLVQSHLSDGDAHEDEDDVDEDDEGGMFGLFTE
eukprot:jgi/Botrbrau1/142/Bobra.0022s0127.1